MVTKKELKTADTERILVDYIRSYASLESNFMLHRGTKQLGKHCKDLEEELVKRGVLSEESVKYLNY